ncbi:PRE C2HC domain-containing protein, partial [Aphis craccivora]
MSRFKITIIGIKNRPLKAKKPLKQTLLTSPYQIATRCLENVDILDTRNTTEQTNQISPSTYHQFSSLRRILLTIPKADTSYWVVISNVHPTTDISSIKDELTPKGFAARNIPNIQSRQSKSPLLFSSSLSENLSQCHIYVRIVTTTKLITTAILVASAAAKVISLNFEKSKDTLASFAHFREAHPANYKGCIKHKTLLRQETPNSRTTPYSTTIIT